ncbi:MAG: DMT family transporter [Chloroflexi bacterium]|nr:DMT family transporter [Chloroflexota bacterium]
MTSLPYVILLGFLFGSTLVVSRFSVGQFDPTVYVGIRLALASLGHAAIYLFSRKHRWSKDGRLWKHSVILGILGTAVPMTFIVNSLRYQSSGITSLLLTANPAFVVVFAHFSLPDERLNRRKTLGVLLALGGAAMLALRGESGLADVSRASPIGYALVLTAMLFGSAMTIYSRKYMSDLDALDVASARMLTAAVVVTPLALLLFGFDETAVNFAGYSALVYASIIGTFAGMLLAFYNIKKFGATAAAMTAYIIPIFAGIGGSIFLDEQITFFMLVGMALIMTGIAIINQKHR